MTRILSTGTYVLGISFLVQSVQLSLISVSPRQGCKEGLINTQMRNGAVACEVKANREVRLMERELDRVGLFAPEALTA